MSAAEESWELNVGFLHYGHSLVLNTVKVSRFDAEGISDVDLNLFPTCLDSVQEKAAP